MKFKLGEYMQIPLYLHWLTLPFFLLIYFLSGLTGIGVWIAALISITLHEYGHCIAALRCGMKVRDVTLSPIGGRAFLQFDMHDPTKELIVTIAGPLVNLAIIIFFIPFFIFSIYLNNVPLFMISLILILINFVLMTFNLLPIFPMDGGRILRALLSYKFGHQNATIFSVKFGQVLALCLIPVAIYFNAYIAAVVLVIICFIAQRELTEVRLYTNVLTIRNILAEELKDPSFKKMPLSELILVLERLDKNTKERLDIDTLISAFEELLASEETG